MYRNDHASPTLREDRQPTKKSWQHHDYHFNSHFLGRTWVTGFFSVFIFWLFQKRTLSEKWLRIVMSQMPSSHPTTVSEHWKTLKAQTETREDHLLASSFHHPSLQSSREVHCLVAWHSSITLVFGRQTFPSCARPVADGWPLMWIILPL